MSEHRTNPQAIRAATLPTLLPVGHIAGTRLSVQVVPKRSVAMLPADRMATPLPEGKVAHELGTPLPPEQCDVVVLLGTAAQDTMDRGIVLPGANVFDAPADPPVSVIWHVELMRLPLVDWQAMHLAKLRGNPS